MNFAEIGFRADTSGLNSANEQLQRLRNNAQNAETASNRLMRSVRNLALSIAGGVSFGLVIRGYQHLADTWSDISSRVGIAVGNMGAAQQVMNELSQTARTTYSNLALTAEGFVRNNQVLRELGKSTRDVLNYTDAVNNALVVSGAKGRQAEFVQESLNRSMALGAMRGLELNNVLNYGGRIAQALAKHFNTTTSGLRRLAQQGKITGEAIFTALTREMEKLREEAESMPATIGDAFTLIGNGLLTVVGNFDKLTGVSETVAGWLIRIADGLKWVGDNMLWLYNQTWRAIQIMRGWGEAIYNVLYNVIRPGLTYFIELGNYLQRLYGAFSQLIPVSLQWGTVLTALTTIGVLMLTRAVIALSIALTVTLVNALRVAMAVMWTFAIRNPIGLLVVAVVAGFYLIRQVVQNVFGVDIMQIIKSVVNNIISLFQFLRQNSRRIFELIGLRIAGWFIWAFNEAIKALNILIAAFVSGMNTAIEFVNRSLGTSFSTISSNFGQIGIMTDRFSARAQELLFDIQRSAAAAFQRDWIGEFSAEVGKLTSNIQQLAVDTFDLDKKNKDLTDGFTKGMKALKAFLQTLKELTEPYDLTGNAIKALDEAMRNGIITNDQYARSLEQLNKLFTSLGGTSQQWAQLMVKNTKGIANALDSLAENTLTKLGDEFIELAITGKANFGDLAKSIIKDLMKIYWNALIVKPLMQSITGAIGGAMPAGGGLGGASIPQFQFAKGGVFDKTTAFAFANGGAFGRGIMGEAGPEAVMPLKRGPDGSLGVQVQGGTNDNSPKVIVQVINNAPNTDVQEERSTSGDGTEIRRIIINTTRQGMAEGEFDAPQSARFGAKPQRVIR